MWLIMQWILAARKVMPMQHLTRLALEKRNVRNRLPYRLPHRLTLWALIHTECFANCRNNRPHDSYGYHRKQAGDVYAIPYAARDHGGNGLLLPLHNIPGRDKRHTGHVQHTFYYEQAWKQVRARYG